MRTGFKFPRVERIIEKITFNENIAIVMGSLLPLPQALRGDQVFGEDKIVKMDKWFCGAGVSFTLGKYL